MIKKKCRLWFFIFALGFFGMPVVAQDKNQKSAVEARKYMQEAEEALKEKDIAAAEAFYRKAIAKDPANAEARYNLGNLYYKSGITSQSSERHAQASKVASVDELRHNAFHNQGNAFMKQKKYKAAVEAYKNALRTDPGDEETRYNLALAKKLLEKQNKGGGKSDKNKKNQENQQKKKQNQKNQQGDQGEKEKNEEGKPDQQKGGEKEKKDKKPGEDQKDNEGKPQDEKQNQKSKGDKQRKEQKRRPEQLSPQQVKNLLEAMGNEEKKVQKKVNAKKVEGAPSKTEKDW